jgi:molecular chaperone GrpE
MSEAESGRPAQPVPLDASASADADADMAALEARVAELTDQRLRTLAELDNARKRYDRDLGRAREQERLRVTREWLPILDNLERALAHAGASPEALIDGVGGVTEQAVRLVGELGFPRQDDLGEPFDPSRHDAAGSRPDADAPPGTIIEVLQPAYGQGDHQLRPALVIVATGD